MGLTPYSEKVKTRTVDVCSDEKHFVSWLDRRNYLHLSEKSAIRERYVDELIGTGVLRFRPEKRGSERLPVEIGYSLDFNKGVYDYKSNGINEVPLKEVDGAVRNQKYRLDSYVLSEFYAEILNSAFKGVVDGKRSLIIEGPPKGGVSYEVGVSRHFNDKYFEFTGCRADPFHSLKIRHADEKAGIIIVDDCLIEGKAMESEARRILNHSFVKEGFAELSGIMVGIDCGFRGKSGKKVSKELEEKFGVKVESIAEMEEVMDYFGRTLIKETQYPVNRIWLDNYRQRVIPEISENSDPRFRSISFNEIAKATYVDDCMMRLKNNQGYTKHGERKHMTIEQYRALEDMRKNQILFKKDALDPFVDFMLAQCDVIDLEKTARIVQEKASRPKRKENNDPYPGRYSWDSQ